MKKIVLVFVLLDQITKVIFTARDFFIPIVSKNVSNGLFFESGKSFGPFSILPMENPGLSFGLSFSSVASLAIVIIVLIWLGIYFYVRRKILSKLELLAFGFIFAGAISNLIDRLILGFVRDWISIGLGFSFNLADAAIFAGLILLLFSPRQTDSGKVSR
ncbi:MAG: signal peptidase II [Acidobacteriaceae bacterium]